VRHALRPSLERALQLAIAATILTAVLASGSLLSWIGPARKLRWLALAALVALALTFAARRRRFTGAEVYGVAGALVAVAVLSAAWSAFPRLTVGRGLAFALLIVAGAGLAAAASAGALEVRGPLYGVLAGVAAVGVGGLLVLVFAHDRAVQPASTSLPERYQGLGGGPDTATMVLALGTPVAVFAAADARRPAVRVAAGLLFLVFVGSIVASGSRGALAAAFAGLFVCAVALVRTMRARIVAVAAVAALLAVAVVGMQVPQPLAHAPASAPNPAGDAATQESQFGRPAKPPPRLNPLPPPRLQDDVGHPPFGVADTTKKPRTLFGTSGRAQAWNGALRLGAERPFVGFGFGTEDHVFIDRYVDFNSNTIEDSYLGLFVELGVVGVALLAALVVLLARRVVGAARDSALDVRVAGACAGVVAAGLVLAFFQSYLYAPGNNATATFWLCTFLLLAATAVVPRTSRV
jgi:O-Antigen ligase